MSDYPSPAETGYVAPEVEYFHHDTLGRTDGLVEEQVAANNRLREALINWLNPDGFNEQSEKEAVEKARALIGEPITIYGRILIPEATDKKRAEVAREIWGTIIEVDGMHYRALLQTAEGNNKLLKHQELVKPHPAEIVAWAKRMNEMVDQIPETERGVGDVAHRYHSLSKYAPGSGAEVEFARLMVFGE